jgi:hypothetical protein
MVESSSDNYLRDLGYLVRESALEAKRRANEAADDDRAFEQGRALAYYEVVSLMKEQALAFGIDPSRLSLADVNPDQDLL